MATSHALLEAADRALYLAKDRGRDQAVLVPVAAVGAHHRARGRGEQLLERHALRLVGEERVVRRVLEQPPHEVGHARDEVADRAVGPHAQALGGDRVLERVAEPAQDLQLEVARRRRRRSRS